MADKFCKGKRELMMSRQNIPQQIVDLQTLLEIAKDNWLEGKTQDAVKLLQRAKREIGLVIWRAVPNGEVN